jgi:hypothetical protein
MKNNIREDFNYTQKLLVNDLMNSSYGVQRWDDKKREEYYTKVVAIAYDLGQKHCNKGICGKIKKWLSGLLKAKR